MISSIVALVRETVEAVRANYLLKALDAVMTARLPDAPHAWRWPYRARASNYGKVRRAAGLLRRLAPGCYAWIHGRLLRPCRLPFSSPRTVELLDCGSARTVFQIGGGADRVLKVSRSSIGRRRAALDRELRAELAEYRRLRAWHAGSAVVLPTSYILLHGPLLSEAAVAHVQPYVPGPYWDWFDGFTEAELKARLADDPALRQQFAAFARETLAAVEREQACADLAGSGNLVLANDGGHTRLVLLDIGVFELAAASRDNPRGHAEIRRRLAYLERLRADLERDLPVAPGARWRSY